MKKNIPGTNFQIHISIHPFQFGIIHLVKEMQHTKECSYKCGDTLCGKVALITGAHKGIGFAIANKLVKEGAKVVITGRVEKGLIEAVEKLGLNQSAYMVWDVQKYNDIPQMMRQAETLFGPFDILVNNAGVTGDQKGRLPFELMDLSHIHYVHDINCIAVKKMCESFIGRRHNGTILNIISNTGILPAVNAYHMSKWALYSYTKGLSAYLKAKDYDITVNGLCPGPIKTDMTFGKGTSLYRKEIPNNRIGLPEEIAELAYIQIYNGLNKQNGLITICDGGESL